MAKAKKEEISETAEAAKFNKASLLRLQKYIGRSDLLCALLSDQKEYTIEQVDALIDKFMKGTVK